MAQATPTILDDLPLGRPLHVSITRTGFEGFRGEVMLTAERQHEQLCGAPFVGYTDLANSN